MASSADTTTPSSAPAYQIRRTLYTDANCTQVLSPEVLRAPNPDNAFLTGKCSIPPALQHMCDDPSYANYTGDPLQGPISGVCTYELGDPDGLHCPSHFGYPCDCTGPSVKTTLPINECQQASESTTTWVFFEVIFPDNVTVPTNPKPVSEDRAWLVPAIVGGGGAAIVCMMFCAFVVYIFVTRKAKVDRARASLDDFDRFSEEEIRQHEEEVKAKSADTANMAASGQGGAGPSSAAVAADPVLVAVGAAPPPVFQAIGLLSPPHHELSSSEVRCESESHLSHHSHKPPMFPLTRLADSDSDLDDLLFGSDHAAKSDGRADDERARRHHERMEQSRKKRVGV